MFRQQKSNTDVDVLTREGILSIDSQGVRYDFGDIPDATFDMKLLIDALQRHTFVLIKPKEDSTYSKLVGQLKSQLTKLNIDYRPFQNILDKLDPDSTYKLKDQMDKLYNRVLFFQVDSLLLDFGRYVFSRYAMLQLENIQALLIRIFSEESNGLAATKFFQLKFTQPDSEQIQQIMSELDLRIDEHRKDIEDRKSGTGLRTDAPYQQAAGNSDVKTNPLKDLTTRFAAKQKQFIEQRKQFKSFVVMLLDLIATSLDQVIDVSKQFFDQADVDDGLKANLLEIVSKIEDGVYYINDDEDIRGDIQQIDGELMRQLGKRGTVRYTKLLNDMNGIVEKTSKQSAIL